MVYAGDTFRTSLLSQFIHKSYTNTFLLQRKDNVTSFKTMAHVKHTEEKTIKKKNTFTLQIASCMKPAVLSKPSGF
jgi:hypothetical protein